MPAKKSAVAAPVATPRTLYIVATPIGNREDITLRALRLLGEATLIAAEDTRVLRRLLTMLAVRPRGRLVALHQHNENAAAAKLLKQLGDGESAVYVCDAGTPGISDPGARLVAAARAAGVTVVPVPGASALTAMLAVAGLGGAGGTDGGQPPVHFYGFAPVAAGQRRQFFHRIARADGCCVLFESPRRIADTLTELTQLWGGDCRAVLGRELTKRNEQIVADTLAGLSAATADGTVPARGEFVLVAEPPATVAVAVSPAQLFDALSGELPPRRAAALAARLAGGDAKNLYRKHILRKKTCD